MVCIHTQHILSLCTCVLHVHTVDMDSLFSIIQYVYVFAYYYMCTIGSKMRAEQYYKAK